MTPKESDPPASLVSPGKQEPKGTDELISAIYDELRSVARNQLARLAPGQTLQPTSLVHEAYVRLVGKEVDWEGGRHFFFAAARAMHDILVEDARKKSSLKRGGGQSRLDLESLVIATETPAEEIVALSEAMQELKQTRPRTHELVLLRFFAGCSAEEAAAAMDASASTIAREWRFARAWLHEPLSTDLEST
jgi:RNA polymerase sigma factor (TIGR02999 family)